MQAELSAGALALAKQLPRIVGRSLLGGLLGALLGGALGTAMLALFGVLGWLPAAGWWALGLGALSALATTIGGGYVGGLRGCVGAVVRMIDELQLVDRLYTLLRPELQRYSQRLRDGARGAEARSEALASLQARSSGAAGVDSLSERVEVYVAGLLHGALAGGLLRALVGKSPAVEDVSRWAEIESAGVERSREALADVIHAMFHGPVLLALLLSTIAAAAPHAIYALLS